MFSPEFSFPNFFAQIALADCDELRLQFLFIKLLLLRHLWTGPVLGLVAFWFLRFVNYHSLIFFRIKNRPAIGPERRSWKALLVIQ
jgi:hypothetical protein